MLVREDDGYYHHPGRSPARAARMALPTDIPDGHTHRSYGGVISVGDDATADSTAYQAGGDASATSTPKTRRTGLAAAGISIAALALVVVGVVSGSRSNAAVPIDGSDSFNELMGAGVAAKAGKATAKAAASEDGRHHGARSTEPSSTDPSAVDFTDFNVIFVLVDDMGHNDVGYTSTDMPNATETLNHYAREGVTISNYYTQSSCTPSRVALLTGRYPSNIGMGYDLAGAFTTSTPYGVPLDVDMVGRHFQNGGYRTAFIGKWNVGHFQVRNTKQRTPWLSLGGWHARAAFGHLCTSTVAPSH